MAERALVDQLVEGGLARDEAEWAADKVLAAIAPVLVSGKTVGVPGVGRLSAPLKRGVHPARPSMNSEFRRARLGSPATVYRGEPYEAAPRDKAKVSVSAPAGRRLA